MPLIRQTATAELVDGTVLGPVRVLHADKLRLEKTARSRGWQVSEQFATTNAFLTWAALTRSGDVTVPYEGFLDLLADVSIDNVGDVDPTQTDQQAD